MNEIHSVRYIWYPAKVHNYRHGRLHEVQSVILHSSCGRESGDLELLTGKLYTQVSANWYINRAGMVYHLVSDSDTAFHAGNVSQPRFANSASVGIEMEHFDPDKFHPKGEDWPCIQVEQASRVCAYLLKKFDLSPEDIFSHAYIADPPGRKSDPVNFPWQCFHNKLDANLKYDWKAEKNVGKYNVFS